MPIANLVACVDSEHRLAAANARFRDYTEEHAVIATLETRRLRHPPRPAAEIYVASTYKCYEIENMQQ